MIRKVIQLFALFILISSVVGCSIGGPETCQVCGYIAVEGDKCNYCSYEVWDEDMGVSEEEYIRSSQKEWFYVEGMEIDFYNPDEVTGFIAEESYKKATTWEPLVTEEEVLRANEK